MSKIKLFESKKIRSSWNEEEEKWYFSVIDIIEVLLIVLTLRIIGIV